MEIAKTIYQIPGGLSRVGEYFDLSRKVLVVTDEGVPTEYVENLIKQCEKPVLYVAKQGEGSKSFHTLQEVLNCMVEHNFSRNDAVVALGGGVVGDLSGMVAGIFMRGIDWYNIPTTMLAQVDSSVGGKTAINMSGIKNIVGVFHQPKGVMIDTELLKSLPRRQLVNGMMEVLKMGCILDEKLVEILETTDYERHIDEMVSCSIQLKTEVVEADERENGLRRILNFGHTIGHGFESALKGKLLHGEAVALGMIGVTEGEVRNRLIGVMRNLGLLDYLQEIVGQCPERVWAEIKEAILHDKKGEGDRCNVVLVQRIGSYELQKVTMETLFEKVDGFSL